MRNALNIKGIKYAGVEIFLTESEKSLILRLQPLI